MSLRRLLRFPGSRKRELSELSDLRKSKELSELSELRKFKELSELQKLRDLKELIGAIQNALRTRLRHSENYQDPLWASEFITYGELIEVWEKPRQKGSYLFQIATLLGLNETEKGCLRSRLLKSISTVILIDLFNSDFDPNELVSENALGELRNIINFAITNHGEKVQFLSCGIQCDIDVDLPEVTSQDAPSSTKDGSTFDLMKIKRWLDSCEEQVQNGTAAILDLYESLELRSRVIDVIRLRVVPAPKRCRYVALSYVWGGQQRWTLRESNDRFFRKDGRVERGRCSKTVWDAIQLCQNVGERYLWVDALCIVQDTEDKHEQIQEMESVYRGAVFTIAAATGEHADVGLLGVSDVPQTRSTFNDQQSPTDPNSFDAAVNSSIWNTRAWTYQERVLSPRLLIFTPGQMYFHCNHGISGETDEDDPHETFHRGRNMQTAQSDAYKLELECNINFNTYAQITQEYSRRTLGHEEDIENAFGGIQKVMSHLFSSDIIFCLPIGALDISLLWYPTTGYLRRRCVFRTDDHFQSPFPSWSWAGWVGPVYYKDLVNISERTVSAVRWRQPKDFRVLYASGFGKNTAFWPQHEGWLRRATPEGRPYYIRRNGNPSHWFCHPITRFIHDPVPLDRDTGHLFFLADKAQSVSWRLDLESSDSNTLGIFHRASGYQLGKVIMQMRYNPTENYELLKISSTTLTDGEKDPAWNGAKAQFSGNPGDPAWNRVNMDISSASEWFDPEAYDPTVCFCLYNVLVTVMRGGITYRVGIGKIHIHAFDEVAVRDQMVRLG